MSGTADRNIWIDHLRSFLTVLVVAHHSSLAYTTFAYFDARTYINSTSPVVDKSRWLGMDIFENFNDIFFMSLMYFISGLFVYRAILKKGVKNFLGDRFKRLGLPFIIAVTFIIPLAYIPSFYLANHQLNVPYFIRDYFFHQQWPVGPPWFIWILLVFNLVAAIIPSKVYTRLSGAAASLAKKPLPFFATAFIIIAVVFIPLSLWVGQYTWTGFGPFDFQLNRFLLYFTFFFFGVCLGTGNWEEYLFTGNRLLNKTWVFWGILCLVSYCIIVVLSLWGREITSAGKVSSTTAYFIFDVFFVADCLLTCLALLALFKAKIKNAHPLWSKLSTNAFGIYLIHYVFVTWLQFLLLTLGVPVILKFFIVFSGALVLSWLLVYQAKKNTLINDLS